MRGPYIGLWKLKSRAGSSCAGRTILRFLNEEGVRVASCSRWQPQPCNTYEVLALIKFPNTR